MNSCTAFGFAPESIRSEAKQCRPSCKVIGPSSAAFHACRDRLLIVMGANGSVPVRPNTSASPSLSVASLC